MPASQHQRFPSFAELVQLNNEATNFLFPKKDDTSDEEDEDAASTAEEIESVSDDNVEGAFPMTQICRQQFKVCGFVCRYPIKGN